MALPYNEWLDIRMGPSTWPIIKELFRDEGDTQDLKPAFTVADPDNRRKHLFEVSINHVHRLPGRKFMIRGFVKQLDGHTNDWFTAHYNPDIRQGCLKFEQTRVDDAFLRAEAERIEAKRDEFHGSGR